MTIEQLEELFEKYDDEFLKFDRVERKLNNRSDLHAFLLLDVLVPGNACMVAAADHDEIYLDVELEELAKVATENQIIELIRSGVRYGDSGLCMFV
jgi:hypothetical protein